MFQILKQTSKLIQSVNILPLCQISITKELAFIEDNSQQKSIFWNSFSISLFIFVHNCYVFRQMQIQVPSSFSIVNFLMQEHGHSLLQEQQHFFPAMRICTKVQESFQCTTNVQCTKCPMQQSPRILFKQFYEKSTFGFPPHSGSLNPLVKANISE